MIDRSLERELFRHRRLLWLFARRELRARYAGSLLGVFWSVVHPLIMLGLYIIVFSTLVPSTGRLPFRSTTAEYAVFLCPGIIAWNWFYETLLGAAASITSNGAIIRRSVFPVAILPVVSLLANGVGFAVAMTAFAVVLGWLGHVSWALVFWLPLLGLLELALMVGPAYTLATLNVFLRDTAQVLVAVLQVLFWATPIVYPQRVVVEHFPAAAWWFRLNPVAHLVDAYRDIVIVGTAPQAESLLYLAIWIILGYHVGRSAFLRASSRFPDEV